jgi:hypothetical protein
LTFWDLLAFALTGGVAVVSTLTVKADVVGRAGANC